MRRIISFLLCFATAVCMQSQEIQFNVLPMQQNNLANDVQEALCLKIKQILTRNSAASANTYNVFGVEPVLEIEESLDSEGLMKKIRLVKGTLTLISKNTADGSLYHSIAIPITGTSEGSETEAIRSMVRNIKTTSTEFTRFIRVSRQKILNFYAENCALILQKAQSLYDLKKYEEAISYLSALSETLPCYEQASVLLTELAQLEPSAADTVIIERIIEKPVIQEKIIEKPIYIEKPASPKPVSPKPEEGNTTPQLDYEIYVSANDLDIEVLRCYGNETQRRITLELKVTNRSDEETVSNVNFVTAITIDGMELNKKGALNDRYSYNSAVKFPQNISLKQNYYVLQINEKIAAFSYIEIIIRGAKVIIRNLPVDWH